MAKIRLGGLTQKQYEMLLAHRERRRKLLEKIGGRHPAQSAGSSLVGATEFLMQRQQEA